MNEMDIGETLEVEERREWRSWLRTYAQEKEDIWLVYYRKSAEQQSVSYEAAVEEALCFGWIDSIVKSIDDEKYVQRFTPRRENSQLSQLNKERIKKLIKQEKMTAQGMDAVKDLFDPDEEFKIPDHILKELKKDEEVWENFQNFPDTYKRIRIGYLKEQRKHGEDAYHKSLNHFIRKTKKNKMFGTHIH